MGGMAAYGSHESKLRGELQRAAISGHHKTAVFCTQWAWRVLQTVVLTALNKSSE